MFAVASDVCGDKLPSAHGVTNIMFWEQLVSPIVPIFELSGGSSYSWVL